MIGRVYKIICSQSNDIYIGSTFNELRVRWQQHKNRYCEYKKNPNRSMSIHSFFDNFDIKDFKIILIKEYEVVDRKHLESKEQLWINKLKCINTNNSFRINWISRKDYYQDNKEKIKEYDRNRQNKEAIKMQRAIKITCACGSEIRRCDNARHERTKKHQKYMSS